MNTNVRITLTDSQRQKYKDIFGEMATRNNIKVRVATMFFKALDEEKPRSCALKTLNISEKTKEKLRTKLGAKIKSVKTTFKLTKA